MLTRLIITAILSTIVVHTAAADVIFFEHGGTIEGTMGEPVPGSDTVTVKTRYGEQEFARAAILTVLSDADAALVKPRLQAGIRFLRKGNLKQANFEFEMVVSIDKKFVPMLGKLVTKYYHQRIAKFKEAFQNETKPSMSLANNLIHEGNLLIQAGSFQSSYRATDAEFGLTISELGSYNTAQGERMIQEGQRMLAELRASIVPDTPAPPPITMEEPSEDEKPPEKEEKKKTPYRTIIFVAGGAILVLALIMKKMQK